MATREDDGSVKLPKIELPDGIAAKWTRYAQLSEEERRALASELSAFAKQLSMVDRTAFRIDAFGLFMGAAAADLAPVIEAARPRREEESPIGLAAVALATLVTEAARGAEPSRQPDLASAARNWSITTSFKTITAARDAFIAEGERQGKRRGLLGRLKPR
jgi:hypothetical protein